MTTATAGPFSAGSGSRPNRRSAGAGRCRGSGNAASIRALLSAGFIPLGSLQLFHRAGHHPQQRRQSWGAGRGVITGRVGAA
jgi:hypothetical protein